MSEIATTFAREWVEFPNPENSDEIFKCDLTWLTSYWNCIFGNGCQGIDKAQPDHGCCSDGAYYYSREDEARVTAAAKKLTPTMWQNHAAARKGGKFTISEIGLDKDRKTKKLNETCIFFNEAKFSKEYFGCALHHLAIEEDKHFIETKPDICWQLPLRRSWEKREVGDKNYDIVVIGEYTREAWGEGGADMDWYCSSNTEAHAGAEPVYLSNKTELIAMMNPKAYEVLASLCDLRMKAMTSRKTKYLPLYVIHPATAGANK
jgi:hypothetical protein